MDKLRRNWEAVSINCPTEQEVKNYLKEAEASLESEWTNLLTIPPDVLAKMKPRSYNPENIKSVAKKLVRVAALQELNNETMPYCSTKAGSVDEFQRLGAQLRKLILSDMVEFLNTK